MDNDGNKITWSVIIIAAVASIGLMFVNFMPSQTANIKAAIGNELSSFRTGNKSDSSSSKSNSSSSRSSSHTAVGTNLLQATDPTGFPKDGSPDMDHMWVLRSGGNGTSKLIETPDRATRHGFQINGNTFGNRAFEQPSPFENKVYTFSVYAKIVSDDDNVTLLLRVWGINTNIKLSSKDWIKVTWTVDATKFDLNANPDKVMQFGIAGKGSVAFAEPKLELGTTATPWSPNPADHAHDMK